jgi:hypothetical protein
MAKADDQNQGYLVVWTKRTKKGKFKDEWECVASLDDAQSRYEELANKASTHVVSIVAVVESTDYDTHPRLQKVANLIG